MIEKNGILSSTAETYVDAVMGLLPDIFADVEKIGLLIAAKYTTDPEPIWRRLELLDKPFQAGGKEEWKTSPGWTYIKLARIELQDLTILEQSKNQFTKSRASIIRPITDSGMWSDENARHFAAQVDITSSKTHLCMNQAGLSNNTSGRLALEVRSLADLATSAKSPSTWLHAAQLAHGPGPARYYAVLSLEDLALKLGTTLGEARLAGECTLFAMIEGPCNINIIALGDLGDYRDPAIPVAALKESGLSVNDGDFETKMCLLDLGYNGKPLNERLIAN
jgi:hypothetical protein